MGLFGPSKKQLQFQVSELKQKLQEIQDSITPEMQECIDLKKLNYELEKEISEKRDEMQTLKDKIKAFEDDLSSKEQDLRLVNLELDFSEIGLYKPVYNFANSEMYKDRLSVIRQAQKELVKKGLAVSSVEFTLDGSLSKGKKLVKDNVKQILRSFNNECDVLVDKVKYNNIDAIRTKITKSYESLNKMNEKMHISINSSYLELKLDELNLSYEYSVKRQEEKELAKEERARLREEAKLQKEIEEARKTINKEKTHYESALLKLNKQLDSDPNNLTLISKKEEIENQLKEINKNLEDIDYREANKRAGYVYIISNIGSFGEDIYKIGMTRRLEPMERVHELGDASVPFNFDLHAMIFSDDAPKLENALHKAFEDKKVNMVNHRREFFKVKLDEIEKVVRENFDKVVEFNKKPLAEQYYESLIISNTVK